jgi:hypothetical protein
LDPAIRHRFLHGKFRIYPLQVLFQTHHQISTAQNKDQEQPGASGQGSPAEKQPKPGALAPQLTQCYSDDLPVWFQLLLKRRGEDPQAAAGHLMTLAKTKNPDHARRRIHQIEEALKLKQ